MTEKKPELPTRPELAAITDRQLLEKLAQTVQSIANAQTQFSAKLVDFETDQADLKERVGRISTRARGPSAHDLEAEKKIADEIEARETLAEKVATIEASTAQIPELVRLLSSLEKFFGGWWATRTGKIVKAILVALVFAAYAALRSRNLIPALW